VLVHPPCADYLSITCHDKTVIAEIDRVNHSCTRGDATTQSRFSKRVSRQLCRGIKRREFRLRLALFGLSPLFSELLPDLWTVSGVS
jgi:hypothetical protein